MSSNVVDNNAQEWSARDFERVTTELPTLGRGNDEADYLGQSCLHTEPALPPPPLLTQLESSFDLDETAGICIGQELCARYVVRRLLGVGGMGAVFAAFDELRQSEVAIKVMHPDLLQTPTALERFQQEALLASNLGHPNIVRVYGPERDGESRFLVMEILEGRTLREEMDRRIEANSPFSWTEALAIVEPLCEALAYAHRSTVHRDIKPDNVMLCNDGTVKLMDFGLARPSDSELTRTAQLVGSFNYMSPEQRQGRRDLGARSDQYSVAVLLYELLTASLPMAPYSSVRELRRDVSRKVSATIDRALSNAPTARFEDMQSFLAALRQQTRRQAANLSWLQAPILLLLSTIVLAWGGISLANWHVQKVEQAEPSALSQSLTASWLSAGQRRLPSSAPSLSAEASTTPLASATEQEPARPALSAQSASSSLADSEGLDAASLSTEAPMPELDPTWLVEEQAMAAEPMSVAVRNVYTARRLMREALRVCDADPSSSLSLGVGDHVELELRENSELGDVVFIQQEGGAGIHSARLLVAGRSYKLLFSESSWQHFRLPHATRAGRVRLEVLSLYQPALGAARLAELQLRAPEGPRSSASEGATVGDERLASVW